MQQNPYAPPRAETAAIELAPDGLAPATRARRLAARLVDALAILSPGIFIDSEDTSTMLVAAGALACLQAVFIATRGQSIGKMVLGTRVEHLDGTRARFVHALALRELPILVLWVVPLAGPIIVFANAAFIFRRDQRCIHDMISRTRVVRISPRRQTFPV